jgi:hypothetical protein
MEEASIEEWKRTPQRKDSRKLPQIEKEGILPG